LIRLIRSIATKSIIHKSLQNHYAKCEHFPHPSRTLPTTIIISIPIQLRGSILTSTTNHSRVNVIFSKVDGGCSLQ
jgi:hypothetical protein